jgi:protein SCO1/2
MRPFLFIPLVLFFSLLLHGAEEKRQYKVLGTIRELHPESREMIIKHEAIPGYMDAMVMPFTVKEDRWFKEVRPGDEVRFSLEVTPKEDHISKFEVLRRGQPQPLAAKTKVTKIKVGSTLSLAGIPMEDQDGRDFDASSLAGRSVVLSFFFTRCPSPEMCPLLVAKLGALQKALKARADEGAPAVTLLCITIDPLNDSPKVLKSYAKACQADPKLWRFLTGSLPDIRSLASRCGADFWEDGGLINHTLRTLVIDPDGKVRRLYTDNRWTSEDLIEAIAEREKR